MNKDIRNFFNKTTNTTGIKIEKKTVEIKEIKPIPKSKETKRSMKKKVLDQKEEIEDTKKKESAPLSAKITTEVKETKSNSMNKNDKKKNVIIDDDMEIDEIRVKPPETEVSGNNGNESEGLKIQKHEINIIKIIHEKERKVEINPNDFFSGIKPVFPKIEEKVKESSKEDKVEKQEMEMEIDDDDMDEIMNELIQSQELVNNWTINSSKSKNDCATNDNGRNDIVKEGSKNNEGKGEITSNLNSNLKNMRTAIPIKSQTNIKEINERKEVVQDAKQGMSNEINNNYYNNLSVSKAPENITPCTTGNTNSTPVKGVVSNHPQIKINTSNDSTTQSMPLWSEKYKPSTISDIVGNQTQVSNIISWWDNWNNCIINGIKRDQSPYNRSGRYENINARALIISGPPGIGKTTTARVLSEIKGYQPFELNASDQRNKDSIMNSVGFLMNNTTLGNEKILTKNLIIMDEVDGMGGTEDKGGIKAWIDIVKKTKVPIIFICNDIYNQKLKSLLNYCYDIKFLKPDRSKVVARWKHISDWENLSIDNTTLHFLADNFQCDIRQCINYLELCSRNKSSDITGIKDNSIAFKKDKTVTISSFDVCRFMLNKIEFDKINTWQEKLDLFFVDFDWIPSWIHENYWSCYKSAGVNSSEELGKLVSSIESVSFGDTIESKWKTKNEWSLLPDKGIHSTIIPAMISSNRSSYPKFPEMFSKVSRMKKISRELRDIKQLFPFYSTRAIKEEIAPLVFTSILNILNTIGKEGLSEVINMFKMFRLSIAQFKESLFDWQSESTQLIYTKLNPSLKTMLTKKLNEYFKNAITKHKETHGESMVKRDEEGNVLEIVEEDDDEVDDESSVFSAVITNKTKKAKSKAVSKGPVKSTKTK